MLSMKKFLAELQTFSFLSYFLILTPVFFLTSISSVLLHLFVGLHLRLEGLVWLAVCLSHFVTISD